MSLSNCAFRVACLSILLYSNSVAAEGGASTEAREVRSLTATYISLSAPVIDGNLDDEIWKSDKIQLARDFIQREPDEGSPASESTWVAVAYDDEALYYAFWCFDSEPDKIIRQLVRRDRWAESDLVTVRLDPYHDHQTGYRFDLNASGVQRDYLLYNDNNTDVSWDGVWESGVKSQPWGWSAEIRIPFHCLRFAEKGKHTWGMDVTRYISRNAESIWWAYSPSSAGGFVSRFGHLEGLSGIEAVRHLEILPYVVSGVASKIKSAGVDNNWDYMKNSGFDIKYGLSSNLIMDGTVNPDFGQVELDRPVLNLSTYETRYEEKRPFFIEGSNLFNTRFQVFYSRRIGRPPRGDVGNEDDRAYDPDFDDYSQYPNATTILSAAKLTGKLGNGTSIAFLNAVTDEEKAQYLTATGLSRVATVEPLANYSVLRLQQDILSNSNVGLILTSASQDQKTPITTGGVDWRLLTNDGNYGISGQTVFSRIEDGSVGYGFTGEAEKVAGKHVRGSVGVTIKDTKLDLNRLGYLGRNNERGGWAWVQYRTNDDWWIVRNSWNNVNIYADWNNLTYNINKGWNFNTFVEFTNNWTLGGGFSMQLAEFDDLETRDNGIWKRPDSWSWWASLNTDQRKKVSLNLNPGSGNSRYGSWWANWVGLEFRPASNMEFSLGANYYRTSGQTRWVDNDDDNSVFADMDQDEVTLRATASVQFTRDLSCQLSGQGYIAGIDYSRYRRYIRDERYDPYEFDEQDFNYAALNSTFILRWEYMPGSTLYLVWTRAMSEDDDSLNDLDISRDVSRLFSGDAENVFTVKASYWWNI